MSADERKQMWQERINAYRASGEPGHDMKRQD